MKYLRFIFLFVLVEFVPLIKAQNKNECPPPGSPPNGCEHWNGSTCLWEGLYTLGCGTKTCDESLKNQTRCCNGESYDPSQFQCCNGRAIIGINGRCRNDPLPPRLPALGGEDAPPPPPSSVPKEDSCEAPAQSDKGVAEVQGDLVFKYLEYDSDATTFSDAAKEKTAEPVRGAGAGTKVIRFLGELYQPEKGDPALNDPKVLNAAPSENLSVNGKLITLNSKPERDLKGNLTLTLVSGDASKLGLFYYDNKTNAYVAYTLGSSIPVEAPGHSGCGIHTWHGYFVGIQVVATEAGPFVLKATVTPAEGASAFTAEVTLLKPLHVDGNRDGQITLDGADTTTSEKPFRFWSNDDDDVEKLEEKDAEDVDPASGTANYTDDKVNGVRDLEDFTRLNLYVGGLHDALLSGDIQVGLKWANPSDITPSIKIWKNLSPNGGREYLTDPVLGGKYVPILTKPVGEVKGGNAVILSVDLLTEMKLSATQPYVHLLFEGASGKGQLVVVFKNRAGDEIGEGSGTWLEIKPFNEYYEHWTCGDTIEKGVVVANQATKVTGTRGKLFEYAGDEDGLSVKAAATYNDYVVFVHGWRMKTYERRAFAETAFKRMYHQGYKGKFGFFSWPTEWVDYDGDGLKQGTETLVNAAWDPQHYDRSEVQARKSGAGPLHGLLEKLRGQYTANRLHVFAHSMGNVVVSEALRAHPAGDKLINSYVACQSAEVAHAYDQAVTPHDYPLYLLVRSDIPDLYRYTPKTPRDVNWDALAEKGDCYHKNLSNRTISGFSNFFNGEDTALSKWEINQGLKPDVTLRTWDNSYAYRFKLTNPPPPNSSGFPDPNGRDQFLKDPVGFLDLDDWVHELKWPEDRFEILAHIIMARSKAAGAVAGVRGEFSGIEQDFNKEYGRGSDSHSAQFLSNFATRRDFYMKLIAAFGLDK